MDLKDLEAGQAAPVPPPVSAELAAAAAAIDGTPASDAAAVGGADAPGGEAREDQGEARRAGAGRVAVLVVGGLAKVVAARWPATAYTAEDQSLAVAVLVPVFLKYGVTPAWLKRWEEEIAAGLVIGGLAWQGFQRAEAAKPAPARDGAAPAA